MWNTQVQSLSTKTLKPINRCFGLGFCPFLNQLNWALRLRTIDTRTTALTQKGCVSCVNNGIGGEHLWSTRFAFCSKGQWRCFVCFRLLMAVGELYMFCTLQLCVLLSSKHSKSRVLSFGLSATPSLITQITDHKSFWSYSYPSVLSSHKD